MRKLSSGIVVALMVSTGLGCGIDNRPSADPQSEPTPKVSTPASPNPPVANPPKKEGPSIAFYWSDTAARNGSVLLKRGLDLLAGTKNAYRADAALTVPWYTPRDIEVTVEGIPGFSKSPVQVSTQWSPKKPYDPGVLRVESWSIKTAEGKNGLSTVRVGLMGLSGLIGMTTAREEVLNVTLEFSQDHETKFTVDFTVVTPPSNITVTQKSLSDFESASHTLPDEWKYLEDATHKLKLIQVLEAQNLSNRAIVLDLPTSRRGKLSQRSVFTDPQFGAVAKDRCEESLKTIEVIEAYSSNFVLLTLNESLPDAWARLVIGPTNSFELMPRQTQLIGLYATPNKPYENRFKTLLAERSPKEFARVHPVEIITYPVSCNFVCDTLNNSDDFRTQCNSIPTEARRGCDSRVATCRGCMTLRLDSGKQEKCNACFHDEHIFSDFKGPFACLSGWKKEPTQTKQGKKGTDMSPIMLEIARDDTYVHAFFGDQPRESDSVPGSINLLRETVVHDQ